MRKNSAKLIGAAYSVAAAITAHGALVVTDTNTAGSTDGTIIYTSSGQTGVTASSYAVSYTGATNRVIGGGGSTGARTVSDFVMAFRLPVLPTGDAVSTASLTVYVHDFNGTPTFDADLWGLGYRVGTASTAILPGTVSNNVSTSTGDFNDVDGDGNPTATTGTDTIVQQSDSTDLGAASGIAAREKLADNVLVPSSAVSTNTNVVPITVNITPYLQELYNDGAASSSGTVTGYSGGLAILRLSSDANYDVTTEGSTRYDVWTNNDSPSGTTPDLAPSLSLDFETAAVTPEPTSVGLLGVAGAGLLRRRVRRATSGPKIST